MRLLFIVPEYPPQHGGGIVTYYSNLTAALARREHRVDVLVGSAFSETAPDYELDGVRVRFLTDERRDRALRAFARYEEMPELMRHLAAAWALWEMADGGTEYDAVEVVDWGLLFVPWVVQRDSARALVALHGSVGQISVHDPMSGAEAMSALIRLIESCGIRHADAVQTSSASNAQFWKGVTGRDIELLQPLVRRAELPRIPAAERSERGLVVARVQRWKGPEFLCAALERGGRHVLEFDWVGRVSMDGLRGRPFEHTMAADYPGIWGDSVKPLGQLPPAEVAALQRRAKVVAVPSFWDVFNFTCIEAMAAGTPVVCADGAGAAQWIEHGINGWRVPAGDVDALANVLVTIGELSESELDAIGVAAQATVEKNFSEQEVLPAKETLLARVASGECRRHPADEWLREICSPGAGVNRSLSFLDQQPLRALVRYALRRAMQRVTQR